MWEPAGCDTRHDGCEIPAQLRERLLGIADELNLTPAPEFVVYDEYMDRLLNVAEAAGIVVRPVGPYHEWLVLRPPEALSPEHLQHSPAPRSIGGPVVFEWQGQPVIAARFSTRQDAIERVALLGPTREAALAFVNAVWRAEVDRHGRRARCWSAPDHWVPVVPAAESDIILPPAFKAEVLAYIDRFWRLIPEARARGFAPRRGLLFVGPTGCGKTLLIRHLMTRYPDVALHVFIPGALFGGGFEAMLGAVEAAGAPALLVLEDIDLALGGSLHRGHLLNVLDGLLAIQAPCLLIASSNDPRPLDRHLLDRPGRFDRIIVVPPPGPDERREMLVRFSTFPLPPAAALDIAAEAGNLTGAHLKEACQSATLAALEGEDYRTALAREVRGMKKQHRLARRLAQGLADDPPIGFRQGRDGGHEWPFV